MLNLFRNLLGRGAELPAEVIEAGAALEQISRERPGLATHALLLHEVLPCLYAEPVRDEPPRLTPEQAREQLEAGRPLLRGQPLPLDRASLRRRWQAIGAVLARRQGQAVSGLVNMVKAGQLDPAKLLDTVLQGQPEAVAAQAEALQLDPALTATVLRWTVFPVLASFQTALAALPQLVPWPHGYCPICGSWPVLGEFRGLEHLRYLRCNWCAADWAFPRLACPFCGNHDHELLGYFQVEGEENRQRVNICDACRGYVKMVSTLTPLKPPHLLVTDLATLHLDLLAMERGYFVD